MSSSPRPRPRPPHPPRPPHSHPRNPSQEASIASGACAHAKIHTARRILSAFATQKGENSVLGQSLEDLQHEAQLAQVRNTHLALAMRTKLALATGTLLARVKKTSPQALAQEELLARVQFSPPQALALGHQARVQHSPPQTLALGHQARVQYSPPLALVNEKTAGAGAIFSTTGAGAGRTAGAGA